MKKLHHGFNMCDDNGDTLASPLPLDAHLRRCQMMHLITRDEGFEIGYDCSCPALTLCYMRKHNIRLAHDRNELDLHPDLDVRSLGRQAKRERPKKKRSRHNQYTQF